jgi:hypothetical protein
MKSLKLMCVSAMTGFALLAMPLGLVAQQQQENQQQQPRLTVTDNSESLYSTSVAAQDRIDGGPTGRFQSSTTTDGTVDYLDDHIFKATIGCFGHHSSNLWWPVSPYFGDARSTLASEMAHRLSKSSAKKRRPPPFTSLT